MRSDTTQALRGHSQRSELLALIEQRFSYENSLQSKLIERKALFLWMHGVSPPPPLPRQTEKPLIIADQGL